MRILTDYEDPRGAVVQVEINGEVWKLVGECNRCGACCEKTKMVIEEFQKEDGTCKHFSFESIDGKKLGKCAIMWGRPAFCMLYPRNPYEKLHDECSYSWERVS